MPLPNINFTSAPKRVHIYVLGLFALTLSAVLLLYRLQQLSIVH